MGSAHLLPRIDFAETRRLEVVAVIGESETLFDFQEFGELIARDRCRAGDGLCEDDRPAIGVGDLHFEVGVFD